MTFRTRLTAFGPISAYIRVVLSLALEFCEIHKIIMHFLIESLYIIILRTAEVTMTPEH